MPLTIDQIVAASSKPPPPKTHKNDVSMWGRLVVGSDEFAPPQTQKSRGKLVALLAIVVVAGLGAGAYFLWPRGNKTSPAATPAAATPAPATGSGSAHEAIAAPPDAAMIAPPAGSAAAPPVETGSGSAAVLAVADAPPEELTARSADAITAAGPLLHKKKAGTPLKKKKTAIKKRR